MLGALDNAANKKCLLCVWIFWYFNRFVNALLRVTIRDSNDDDAMSSDIYKRGKLHLLWYQHCCTTT